MDASDRRSHARKELLEEFNDVFNTTEELKTMTGEPMKIHLKENVETFAISTTRSIPFAWRDEVKENLDRMTRQGIVKPLGDSPTRWCHPLVVVPKSNGGVRLCVDLTKLNTFVRRPIHPMKTPKEAVSNIKPVSKYFSTLDATQANRIVARIPRVNHVPDSVGTVSLLEKPHGPIIHGRRILQAW